ncbi:hypothetical protein PNA2_0935 [Pyrococcus sp. NA2]|uniref:DUF4855 domain-containing protein n=1 Tax=Pyrococcus sp. (strain NA2) TaxID=342949 RepID=UPI000209A90E|nr:DUF4855 domain-containing protein [Pyrococcus sp. NA2]AEC51851.1 hypothetical protein PNA2_0935 [Pyrococcus sp. NA2]
MPKIGLWWIKWDNNSRTYNSRMRVGSRKATAMDFLDRGFDRVVFLGGEGRGINYTGNGYEDGRQLALWIRSNINSIEYYITIPFSYGSGDLRDNPANGFESSYWREWIDGVLSVDDDNRVGFYWSYESCLQGTPNDPVFKKLGITDDEEKKEEYIKLYIKFLDNMSSYIRDHGLEVIWIPTIGNRNMNFITKKEYVSIPILAKYFDYVFVQPHYYQTTKLDDGSEYTFQELVKRLEWMKNNGLSIEMEADNSIIGEKSNCAYCKSVQGWWKNNYFKEKTGCDMEPTPEIEDKCIERACDYASAIVELYFELFGYLPVPPEKGINRLFPYRAYYFGTDLKVIDRVRSKCSFW